MDQPGEENNWRLYERLVAAFEAENSGIELSVTPNARIKGLISHKSRQIDVLLDARWGDDLSRRIIVDAKLRKKKLDIKDIESFEGMMRDCGAERGILVCPSGWSEGASRRAQDAITITLLPLEDLKEQTSWASFDQCIGKCHQNPRLETQKGLVLWDAQHLLSFDGIFAVVYTGKCDVCHNFHVWCWGCGEKFALVEEGEHKCYCQWLWVSAIEEEVDDSSAMTLNAVHLLLVARDQALPLDRRRLR